MAKEIMVGFRLKITAALLAFMLMGFFCISPTMGQEEEKPEFTPEQTEKALQEVRKEQGARPVQTKPVSLETLRMMEEIEKKTKELKNREEKVRGKERLLTTLGKKVKADLDEIKQTLKKTEELLGMSKDIKEEKMDALVKIYSAMPPQSIAPLMKNLDEKLAVQIITRMKSKIAGQVLSQLDPKVAKNISEKIIGKKLLEKTSQ